MNDTYEDFQRGSVRLTTRGKVLVLALAGFIIWNLAGIQIL